jgi:hypothetical protein
MEFVASSTGEEFAAFALLPPGNDNAHHSREIVTVIDPVLLGLAIIEFVVAAEGS